MGGWQGDRIWHLGPDLHLNLYWFVLSAHPALQAPLQQPPSFNQSSVLIHMLSPYILAGDKDGRRQHSSCIWDAGFPPLHFTWMPSPDMSIQLRGSQATCCILVSTGESWAGKKCQLSPEGSWAGHAFLICGNTSTLSQVVASEVMAKTIQNCLPHSGKASSGALYSMSALPWETANASVWEDAAMQAPEQRLFLSGDLGSRNMISIA